MARTRIHLGEYYADILAAGEDSRPYFAYVVQKRGSADVLALGWCETEAEAIQAARHVISTFCVERASA